MHELREHIGRVRKSLMAARPMQTISSDSKPPVAASLAGNRSSLWEAICRVFKVSEFIFPTPDSDRRRALVRVPRPDSGPRMQTFWTTMVGFALGVVVGPVLGLHRRHVAHRLQRRSIR